MKVSKLIEELSKLNQDEAIYIFDNWHERCVMPITDLWRIKYSNSQFNCTTTNKLVITSDDYPIDDSPEDDSLGICMDREIDTVYFSDNDGEQK